MTFPSGGFPAQGPQSQQPQQGQGTQFLPPAGAQPPQPGPGQHAAPGRAGSVNPGMILPLAVTVLGLVAYFLSFSETIGFGRGFLSFEDPVQFMLLAGLIAAFEVAPRGPKLLPVVALLSVLAFFILLGFMVEGDGPSGIAVFLFILSILQALVAVAALLADYGVLKMPARRPQQPAYGGPGQYGPPAQFAQHGPPSGPFGQPSQFGGAPPPGQPPASQAPAPQQTQYAPQQGQFLQQPPGYGQEQRPPKPESEQ